MYYVSKTVVSNSMTDFCSVTEILLICQLFFLEKLLQRDWFLRTESLVYVAYIKYIMRWKNHKGCIEIKEDLKGSSFIQVRKELHRRYDISRIHLGIIQRFNYIVSTLYAYLFYFLTCITLYLLDLDVRIMDDSGNWCL